jgi:ABC-type nitrate/sulfonate/bicarbonate transport system substrate-binding protein
MKTMLRSAALVAALAGAAALGGPAQADTMEKTSVALPATTITFLPVYVAEDTGMWKKLGLDVELHNITGIGSTNAMLAGSVDFAVQSGPSLIRGNIRGRHMLGIAEMADHEAFALMARKASFPGLDRQGSLKERVTALKGKRINVDAPNTVVDVLLRYYAQKAGLNAKTDMTEVYMQPTEAIAALKSGAIDAAMLNYPWVETAEREGAADMLVNAITELPELTPTIATTTTTRQGFCDDHKSICAKLAHGYVESHKYIHEHSKEALDIALKRMPGANPSDLEKSLQVLVKATPEVPRYNAAAFAHTQELMIFGGILRKDEAQKDFTGMFTNKYVDMFAPPSS